MTGQTLIGREKEIRELTAAAASPVAEMIALVGRRRVGKTFLVKSVYAGSLTFELVGTQGGSVKEQLTGFQFALTRNLPNHIPNRPIDNWLTAFQELVLALEQRVEKTQPILFFDELPWLAKSDASFLRALGWFWNAWASQQSCVVVICGSAASWMLDNVVNHTGGLHNRITRLLRLQPFTLAETEAFARSRGIRLNRPQLLQLQMTIGGIPMYLNQITAGRSAAENIQAICFRPDGYLFQEFDRLYHSLFHRAERHVAIVRALARKRMGMTRDDIAKASQISNGGGLTKLLNELAVSGFISIYGGYRKKVRQRLYRLTDAYSLFYLTYIERLGENSYPDFRSLSDLPSYHAWAGYAFENTMLQHVPQIKGALGIGGVGTTVATFYQRADDDGPGAQIDLLIDRRDKVINICEAKYSENAYRVTKSYAADIERKLSVFTQRTGTKKHLFFTLLTVAGVQDNEYRLNHVDQVLTIDDYFMPTLN